MIRGVLDKSVYNINSATLQRCCFTMLEKSSYFLERFTDGRRRGILYTLITNVNFWRKKIREIAPRMKHRSSFVSLVFSSVAFRSRKRRLGRRCGHDDICRYVLTQPRCNFLAWSLPTTRVNPVALLVSGCVSRSSTLPRRVASRCIAQEPSKNGTYYANRQRKRSTDKERDTGREGRRKEVRRSPVERWARERSLTIVP